jgi:hypothetical protein
MDMGSVVSTEEYLWHRSFMQWLAYWMELQRWDGILQGGLGVCVH